MISYIYIFCLLPRQTSTAHQCNKVDNQLSAWAMTMSSFEIAKLSAVSTGMGWEREPAYRIISCHNFDSRQKLCKIVTLTTERRWKEKKESARVKWLVLFFIPSFNHIIHHGNCLDPSQTPTTHNTQLYLSVNGARKNIAERECNSLKGPFHLDIESGAATNRSFFPNCYNKPHTIFWEFDTLSSAHNFHWRNLLRSAIFVCRKVSFFVSQRHTQQSLMKTVEYHSIESLKRISNIFPYEYSKWVDDQMFGMNYFDLQKLKNS